jgi:hypothetical protein
MGLASGSIAMPRKLLSYSLAAAAVFLSMTAPPLAAQNAKLNKSGPGVLIQELNAQKPTSPNAFAANKPAPRKGLGGGVTGSVEIDVNKIKKKPAKTTAAKDASFLTLKFSPEPTKGAPQKPKGTLERR